MIMSTCELMHSHFNHKTAKYVNTTGLALASFTLAMILVLVFIYSATNDTAYDADGDDLGSANHFKGIINHHFMINAKSKEDRNNANDREGPKGRKHHMGGGDGDTGNGNAEKGFIVPLLSGHVGDNNQVMEYMGAAVVARSTKRTLCLTPFLTGPAKHNPLLSNVNDGHGSSLKDSLAFKERYDVKAFSRFVNVASEDSCLRACGANLDSFWWLKDTVPPYIHRWKRSSNATTHKLSWSFVGWESERQIEQAFSNYTSERCVGLGGLFPGLRWRGAYLAAYAYLHPSIAISEAASAILRRAHILQHSYNIDDHRLTSSRSLTPHPFLAVHWRFDEAYCPEEDFGLCFLRCRDGSVIDSGLHPLVSEDWNRKLHNGTHCIVGRYHVAGLTVRKQDIIDAILDKAHRENVSYVHLATDGWLRGEHAKTLVTEVVTTLRKAGLRVVGLWSKIPKLPNFPDGTFFNFSEFSKTLRMHNASLSSHSVSQIEQEICSRATAFLGSGESTWSLTVFRTRMATRMIRRMVMNTDVTTASAESRAFDPSQLSEGNSMTSISTLDRSADERVIESLMGDLHAAGLQCQYQAFFNKANVKATMETSQDEDPDAWLDIQACEGRTNKGGTCTLSCF